MIAAYIIFSLDIVNFYMFNAVFIKQCLGLEGSYTLIGLSASFYSFLSFGWKPIAGSLSDKKGALKLLNLCQMARLFGTILAFASDSLLLLFLSRLILAFSSPIQVLVRTILTNVNKENQSKDLATLGIVTAISFMGGALVCGQLFEYTNGIKYIYGLMVINTLTALILTKALPLIDATKKDESELKKSAIEEITSSLKTVKNLSTSDKYWDIFLIKVLVALSFSTIDSNMMIIFENKGIEGKNIGYLVAVVCFLSILANIVQVRINKFYKNDVGYVKIVHSGFVVIISLLFQGFSANVSIYVFFVSILCIFRCFVDTFMMEILLSKVTDKENAIVLGSFDSLQSLTDLISPLLGSVALQFLGIPSIYVISSVSFAFVCYIANSVNSELKKQ